MNNLMKTNIDTSPRKGWGNGYVPKFPLPNDLIYTEIEIALAVIRNDKETAFVMAKQSGKHEFSDTVEGRVLQGDWQDAFSIAKTRLDFEESKYV